MPAGNMGFQLKCSILILEISVVVPALLLTSINSVEPFPLYCFCFPPEKGKSLFVSWKGQVNLNYQSDLK